jgi:hypothetical protein
MTGLEIAEYCIYPCARRLGIVAAVAIGIAGVTQLRCACGGDSAGHGRKFSS